MVPPPITPSPHRFITKKPPNAEVRPPSNLRFQHASTQQSASQQFSRTPRFTFESTQKTQNENAIPATQYSSPLSRRPRLAGSLPVEKKEEIEETRSEDGGEQYEDEQGRELDYRVSTQTIHKRRRPNPPTPQAQAIIISSSPSPSSPPSTPPLPTTGGHDRHPYSTTGLKSTTLHTTRPRFVLPTSPSNPTTTSTTNIPSRPPLILPPRPATPPPPDIPAFFSPHRRAQKYISGGLASTVRDWIVEEGQVAYQQAHARGREEEIWDVRIRVAECRAIAEGVGTVFVVDGSGQRWVLVGKGRGEGDVGMGVLVGVKGAVWEVDVEGVRWKVGLAWKVLDG